jgi:hypothetical protein
MPNGCTQWRSFALVGLTGCFAPTPVPGSPCPTGVCPSSFVCSPATQTCERAAIDANVADATPLVDAAPGCFGIGVVVICPKAAVMDPLVLATPIDTGGPACIAYTGSQPGELCVLAGTNVTVLGRVMASGPRPLVLLATDTLAIEGVLDVASRAGGVRGPNSSASACARMVAQGDRGGPGGTFGGRGGSGGAGETNGPQPSAPLAVVAQLRAGCDGGAASSALGGAGGGAVYLVAGMRIRIAGTVNASGAGGAAGSANRGGGGGGSGGMIGLDAPSIELNGSIFANGGGGGASDVGAGRGEESLSATIAGRGGRAGDAGGADGGDGSARTVYEGRAGASGNDGGGGGGGGAGVIRVFPPQVLSGPVSPPAT